ncbi:MAG TPA: hypothetical protein VFJ92_06395 [Gemmatimonadales bacterium]|jgi:hypothetical protein|nr:hypothetical protein [Gemmatimonadales bacterium]
MSGIREARLRPEASEQYPGAPAGVWLPAGSLASNLRAQRLPEGAFEFRGGRPEAPTRYRIRTRWGDHP